MSEEDEKGLAKVQEPLVPMRVEVAIKERLNQLAKEKCKPFMDAFVSFRCSKDRTVSVLWACREVSEKLRFCNKGFTDDRNVLAYKREYVLIQEEREREKKVKQSASA